MSHQYDPQWPSVSDCLLGYVNPAQMQRWMGLVIDDELRELAAKVRERLALVGNHKIAPMYLLALEFLEAGLCYKESESLRTRLKAEMRDAVDALDGILAREGTQREREERKADAIAKDRRQIMGAVRDSPGNAVSFELPMRWFDDWSRAGKDGRWDVWPTQTPETLHKWDSGEKSDPIADINRAITQPAPALGSWFVSRAQYDNMKRCEELLAPNRTPAEQEAYMYEGNVPQVRAKYPRAWLMQRTTSELRALYEREFGETDADEERCRQRLLLVNACECVDTNAYDCRDKREGTTHNAFRCGCECHKMRPLQQDDRLRSIRWEWGAGHIRRPSREEQQPFFDELAKFADADYDKLAIQRETMGTFPKQTPKETEVLRAWATYYLQTELFDRAGPHEMSQGEAIPHGLHGRLASRYAAQVRETTEATCTRLVGAEVSTRLRREVNELVRNATRNGGDVVKMLERYIESLPPLPPPNLDDDLARR